ncbi:MAG: helix-turn-helix transcriptional regulator [Candidatus Heimdallarchaeota archaeon]|nr:MAG: helix-turn-helix transcriptional regulator [Candidatus Heimdallarchaeota archaeon]
MIPEPESEITEVLKALNHRIRREILRMLNNNMRVPYSEFLYKLKLPASSNVAYHLSLLAKANLVEKDQEGKYSLTQLGRRSALLIDLAVESRPSPFSDFYLAFSQLNPLEIVFGAWYIFFFIVGLYTAQNLVLIGLLFIFLSLGSIFLIVYRTKTLWTLLLLNNFIWLVFVPENRKILVSIVLTNVCGLILLIPEAEFMIPISPFVTIIGGLLVLASLILSGFYLYISSGKRLPITLRGGGTQEFIE